MYGTWVRLAPVRLSNRASVRCGGVPLPLEPALSLPFCAAAARSFIDLTGELAGTTTSIGDEAMRATGTRSFCMLNGSLGNSVTLEACVSVTASQV
ncbi:hypothetical protein D3C81_1467440 [compost metagenome]